MQGRRGTIGFLPESLEFGSGSSSSNSAVDEHIFCFNMRNSAESQMPEYLLSSNNINPSFANSINHEWQNLGAWNLGEPSSSNTQNEVNNNDQKREIGLSSSSISAGAIAGPRLEERRFEVPTNNTNTSPTYMLGSNSRLVLPNLDLNEGITDFGGDNSYHVEHSNMHKSIGPLNEHIPPTIGSGPIMLPSGNNGLFVEDTNGRSGCSVDTRRTSCKRKASEQSIGQSSDSGSSSHTQHTDGSAWNPLLIRDSSGNSFNRSTRAERANARLRPSMGDGASESVPESNVAASLEHFHRNFRLRTYSPGEQTLVPPTAFSTGTAVGNPGVSSSSSVLPRFHPVDNSPDLRSVLPVETTVPLSQPLLVQVPAFSRSVPSFRWGSGSSSTDNHSSNSVLIPDSDNPPHEESSSRNMHRNILEHPIFVTAPVSRNLRRSSSSTDNHSSNPILIPDSDNPPHEEASSRNMHRNVLEHPIFVPAPISRNLRRIPTRASNNANLSIAGNVASSLRTGSSSSRNPLPPLTWGSRPNPPQHPQRLSEFVRRSLFSSGSEAAGSASNNYSSLRGPSASSDSRGLSSGVNPEPSSWFERSGDSEFGLPHPLRSLAVAGEGSSRLVSELRTVLGRMRRGGNLRLEDVMILDPSVFSGIADIHDRHRDMRLDVDNMSYEELLALEERIGNVSTGLSEETVLKLLKKKKYSADPESQVEAEPCCVCQEEYKDGDDIGSLDCGHDYHTDCIKQWLINKNSCPICKTTGLAT